ncbi:pirin family protein [Achromobacter dolens]|uniref:pirin family protein n=1 Tax=Achromobacter dolens TaxID=1287738 RepID=UPI003F5BD951
MTIRLSPPVAKPFEPAGDACSFRQFRQPDFPRGMSPLVLAEHFVMTGPSFAPHPHAGMSAVTLLLEDSRGALRSRDSMDNDHEIRAGDLHWTVAGRGVIHDQQPVGESRLNGVRLYVNLPQRLKSLPPEASLLRAWEMPVLQGDAGRVRVVSGRYDGWEAPLATPEPLLILDGWLRPGASRLVTLPAGWNAWLYAVHGELGVRARHQITAPARPPADLGTRPMAPFRPRGRGGGGGQARPRSRFRHPAAGGGADGHGGSRWAAATAGGRSAGSFPPGGGAGHRRARDPARAVRHGGRAGPGADHGGLRSRGIRPTARPGGPAGLTSPAGWAQAGVADNHRKLIVVSEQQSCRPY